ncbi:extracellular calcium-sensing receptor-like, partial [Tupaia chinensis]|uniref:extracellular calcium-sensing receptor-like n=1 Tax=Tupaia chinensis TaxID=246437 RepID=UPI000FFC70C7
MEIKPVTCTSHICGTSKTTLCTWYQWKNYRYVLAFYFAVEQINKSPHLLPNLSLGYNFYNAFPSDKRTLESALFLLSGENRYLPNYNCWIQKQLVIIAGNTPTFSAQVGTLLELYKSPQLHPFLRKSQLTNSIVYNKPLDEKRKMVQYDIHNLMRFSNGSLLFVEVEDFVYKSTQDQGLVINEKMINLPVNFKE